MTLELSASRPGKNSSQLCTSATWPECIISNWPSQVEAVRVRRRVLQQLLIPFQTVDALLVVAGELLVLAEDRAAMAPDRLASSRTPASSGRTSPGRSVP